MRLTTLFLTLLLITACGGGGGGGSDPTPSVPAPSVNFSANPNSVLIGSDSTLTWSSSNASSCSASGAWSGSRGTSGSETVTISGVGNTNFTITCSGEGGSRSATVTVEGYRLTDGVVVDGYISGADVFIDENANYVVDSNESSTTSDNEGKFTIKYADGSLISLGGTDLDSQTLLDNLLITHKLTGHSEFKAVTPVTSVAAFMQDASSVNPAFGIDADIDVFTFDPVANKGDGGINDYLYEKGNQLTVLAFALQNIVNDLNATTETTQDYFKAIAEEVDAEFANTAVKVDIETETFITNVFNNILTTKSITMDETIKANTVSALVGVLPIIQVQSTDNLTTAVIRFSLSTLQNDIVGIANGTATQELITSYTSDIINYIAEDQNIDNNEITPDITAIADSVTTDEDVSVTINLLANDSYITTAPIALSLGNASNGSVTLAESSPEQAVFTPNADFYGSDNFTYTITQGDKVSSSEVTVTVTSVNDAPSIDVASTIQVLENQTAVTTVSVSDVDQDELTLTLGGTDADSFNLSNDNFLSLKEEADYETKPSYGITLSLTDGTDTVTKDVTIDVINVNDVAPVFTSDANFSAAENQIVIGTLIASDADGDSLTYSQARKGVDNNNAFIQDSDSSLDEKDFYAVSPSSDQIVTLRVFDIDDQMKIIFRDSDGNAKEELIFGRNIDTIINVQDYIAVDGSTIDLELTNNLSGYTMGWELNVEDEIVFSNSCGEYDVYGCAEDSYSEGVVYKATIQLGKADDNILVNSTSGQLTFETAPDYEAKDIYEITAVVTDGKYTTNQDITINVINANDLAPEFTSDPNFSFEENRLEAIGTVTATDSEGDDITFSVSGSELEITSTGVLSFLSPPDYESKTSYSAQVTASDGVNTAAQDIIVTITNVDEDPEFTSDATFSAPENQTAIGTVTASDPEGNNVTLTVSGSELEITSAGVLSFVLAPDYETKTSYSATVTANDGIHPATQDITVNVTNVNDNFPAFTSSATLVLLKIRQLLEQ